MKKNEGAIDRTVRIVLGLAIGGYGLYAQSWWGLIGVLPLATGLLGTCLVYLPFGLSTCKMKQN